MTQDALTKIFDTVAGGGIVVGWSYQQNNDQLVLFNAKKSEIWERALPDGEWVLTS